MGKDFNGFYKIVEVQFHDYGKRYYYLCDDLEEVHCGDYLVVENGIEEKYVIVCVVFWTRQEDIDFLIQDMKPFKRVVVDEEEKDRAYREVHASYTRKKSGNKRNYSNGGSWRNSWSSSYDSYYDDGIPWNARL